MPQPSVKSHKWWLFCRIYAPLGMAAWFAIGTFAFSATDWMLYTLISFPLAVISFLMLFTLAAFRFDCSCFGRYNRTPWPAEKPLLVEKTSFGRAGFAVGATTSAWMWSLFASGLGIRIPYDGRAFIPLEAILEVRRPSGGFRATLIHGSPEVRSRISIPSKRIVEGIRQLLAKRQSEGGPESARNSAV